MTMKPVVRHSRVRGRPLEVTVDFVLSAEDGEEEVVFLSREVLAEVGAERGYVAVGQSVGGEGGWIVMRVGQWGETDGRLEGRKVVVAGVGEEVRKRFGTKVLVQSVTPAPLDTVVLKVSTQDYDSVSEDHDAFQEFQTRGTVFRAGKTISTPSGNELEITLCEPVRQGILGEETEIILVTDSQHDNTPTNGLGTPFSVTSRDDSDLDISQFLSLPSSEDDFNYDAPTTETTTLLPPTDDPTSRGVPLRVVVLQRPLDKFSLDPGPADNEDDEFRVYAHVRDIAHIGVFSGNWVPPPHTPTLTI
jgi:hypothetical protein